MNVQPAIDNKLIARAWNLSRQRRPLNDKITLAFSGRHRVRGKDCVPLNRLQIRVEFR